MRVGHVADVDDCAVDLFHWKVIDPIEENGAGVERDVPIELAEFRIAGWQDQILRRNGVEHVIGR